MLSNHQGTLTLSNGRSWRNATHGTNTEGILQDCHRNTRMLYLQTLLLILVICLLMQRVSFSCDHCSPRGVVDCVLASAMRWCETILVENLAQFCQLCAGSKRLFWFFWWFSCVNTCFMFVLEKVNAWFVCVFLFYLDVALIESCWFTVSAQPQISPPPMFVLVWCCI